MRRRGGGRLPCPEWPACRRQAPARHARWARWAASPAAARLLDAVERVAARWQRDVGVVARQRQRVHHNVGCDCGILGAEAGDATERQRDGRDDQQRQPGLFAHGLFIVDVRRCCRHRTHEQWTVQQQYLISCCNGRFDWITHPVTDRGYGTAVPRSPATLGSRITSATMRSPTK